MRATALALCLALLVLGLGARPGPDDPVPDIDGRDGSFRLTAERGSAGRPCVAFVTPAGSGGHCFVAVGRRGGWALEAEPATSTRDTVFFGATIRRAARVRFGRVASLPTGRYAPRFGVRFFAGAVPRRALRVPRNHIVALDRRGRLLGRQHWNDGRGGFGRCDGLWDRRHGPC